MNVYLRDIRLYLDIDPIEATIRLSQTMKRPRIIARVEEGGIGPFLNTSKRRFSQRRNSFRAYTQCK